MGGQGSDRVARAPLARADHRPATGRGIRVGKTGPRLIEYTLPGGHRVLVGRTDSDNDYLSLRLARPDDFWFHVRGVPGSHVVLQSPEGAQPDREALRQAAAIAAYHSRASEAGIVSVSCTRARFVRKPRGAKPGTVEIRKETVLKVRPAEGPRP